jgi:hypothetical protein
MKNKKSSTMGALVYCHLFASPSTRGAGSFSYYRSMPWIDSTKKIRWKMASGNSRFAIYSVQKHIQRFSAMAKKMQDIF